MKGKFFSFMPLYSIRAWGRYYGTHPFGYWWPNPHSFKGYAIYQHRKTWHGIMCIKERYYKPGPPPTPLQWFYKHMFASGVHEWQKLTAGQKKAYDHYRYPLQMSGYNKFLHYYLRDHY